MSDYPKVRAWHTCAICQGHKVNGLILCWPCHRAAKETARARGEDGDYPRVVTELLDAIEKKLNPPGWQTVDGVVLPLITWGSPA